MGKNLLTQNKTNNMEGRLIYLLWLSVDQEPFLSGMRTSSLQNNRKELKGAFDHEDEAKYYCDELNKVNTIPHLKYYVGKFYCNTRFYFTDANGNTDVALYYKPNEKAENN